MHIEVYFKAHPRIILPFACNTTHDSDSRSSQALWTNCGIMSWTGPSHRNPTDTGFPLWAFLKRFYRVKLTQNTGKKRFGV